MQYLKNLRVLQLARQNLRACIRITKSCRGFSDIRIQIERSALSVVSNIGEGAGYGSPRQFIKFLKIARGSNNELYLQLSVLADLGVIDDGDPLFENLECAGKMMSCLIKRLDNNI